MRNMLAKEIMLGASPLSFIFILFGLMFFLPGYPVLCGVFFITLGIYQSYQNAREANDIVFSALLPIAKHDVVKAKFIFTCFIELCGAVLMAVAVVLRMTVLADVGPYRTNALMNANLFALGIAFVGFGLFNTVFVGGFFKTAYKLGKPFVTYIIAVFLLIGVAEATHHVPGFEAVNAFGTEHFPLQAISAATGAVIYAATTALSYKKSCSAFEKLDL